MDEFILSVPLDSVVESLGNGEQLYEFDEPVESLVECFDDRLPSHQRRVVDLHLKS